MVQRLRLVAHSQVQGALQVVVGGHGALHDAVVRLHRAGPHALHQRLAGRGDSLGPAFLAGEDQGSAARHRGHLKDIVHRHCAGPAGHVQVERLGLGQQGQRRVGLVLVRSVVSVVDRSTQHQHRRTFAAQKGVGSEPVQTVSGHGLGLRQVGQGRAEFPLSLSTFGQHAQRAHPPAQSVGAVGDACSGQHGHGAAGVLFGSLGLFLGAPVAGDLQVGQPRAERADLDLEGHVAADRLGQAVQMGQRGVQHGCLAGHAVGQVGDGVAVFQDHVAAQLAQVSHMFLGPGACQAGLSPLEQRQPQASGQRGRAHGHGGAFLQQRGGQPGGQAQAPQAPGPHRPAVAAHELAQHIGRAGRARRHGPAVDEGLHVGCHGFGAAIAALGRLFQRLQQDVVEIALQPLARAQPLRVQRFGG